MHLSGRLSAAAEVLQEVLQAHRPASLALSDWGRAHRFAGSGDRAAIGNIVYDVLRARSGLGWRMQSENARSLVLSWAVANGTSVEELAELCERQHGPGALTDEEQTALAAERADAPPHVAANIQEWCWPQFERAFAAGAVEQGVALAQRAPVDIRVNTLKTTIAKLSGQLAKFNVSPGPLAENCLRIEVPEGLRRTPNLEADPAYQRGAFEVQDAASQVAAMLVDAQPGMQVADICAGAGGKTLALAAAMQNKGQIHAWDADRNRLKPIINRLTRAGARNVQVIPADEPARLDALEGTFDRVLIDAPCSGSGSWRRKPDAKWRLTPESLANRIHDQRQVLARAAKLAKPGGRVVYVTCSLFPEENADQVAWFLQQHQGFSPVPFADVWSGVSDAQPPVSADGGTDTLTLTPATHGTDGFFVAVLEKAA